MRTHGAWSLGNFCRSWSLRFWKRQASWRSHYQSKELSGLLSQLGVDLLWIWSRWWNSSEQLCRSLTDSSMYDKNVNIVLAREQVFFFTNMDVLISCGGFPLKPPRLTISPKIGRGIVFMPCLPANKSIAFRSEFTKGSIEMLSIVVQMEAWRSHPLQVLWQLMWAPPHDLRPGRHPLRAHPSLTSRPRRYLQIKPDNSPGVPPLGDF